MDFEELAIKAYRKEGVGKFWDLPTRYAYINLEKLYFEYRTGDISKEKSVLEKNKIKKEYNQDLQNYERYFNINKKYLENRKKNTELLCEIGKSKNKDDILKYSLEIIANDISDDNFVDRVLKQLELN
jgi:hypothetical protein